MSELFTHKQVHSTIWLITIIVSVIIVAGILIVIITDNASVAPTQSHNMVPATSDPATLNGSVQNTANSGERNNSTVNEIPNLASGAMNLSGATSVQVGSNLEVQVRLDSGGKNINLARVVISYDPNMFEFERFDATGSVLPLQVKNQQTRGSVALSRGVPGDANPEDTDDGYTGTDGLFGTLVFKTLSSGTARIYFDQGQTKMFLDDGRATPMNLSLQDFTIQVN